MPLPTLEIYSDLHCPWAYLAVYRLRKVWPEYRGHARIVWRSLALEYKNERGTPKPILDAETDLLGQIEPALPIRRWPRPDWEWPATFWPAFEALACAQAQSEDVAFEMSWALRLAFFDRGCCPSLRHELFGIARQAAPNARLDMARFEDDWNNGRYKASVLEDSRRGWAVLHAEASPTFVLPSGRQITNPAAGKADIDGERGVVRSYTPYDGDPLAVYRAMLDEVTGKA